MWNVPEGAHHPKAWTRERLTLNSMTWE